MKKVISAFAICGAMFLTPCDSNAGAQNGDMVVIDFVGKKDNVAFEGGTAQNYPLVLGSGQFVPGFEEQLVGMEKGETRDINITFPENYYPELAGQDVVFTVTVNEIVKQ